LNIGPKNRLKLKIDEYKQRKEKQICINKNQKYSTKKPIYWHGYILSEVTYVISEARRFPEPYVISGGM
jgi:hypothetical protein